MSPSARQLSILLGVALMVALLAVVELTIMPSGDAMAAMMGRFAFRW